MIHVINRDWATELVRHNRFNAIPEFKNLIVELACIEKYRELFKQIVYF